MADQPSRKEQLLAQLASLDGALREKAETHLHEFVRQSWKVVEPKRPFQDSWHIGAICEHLEAVVAGQIANLGINVPPSTGKSTIVSVQFPAWLWLPRPARKGAPANPLLGPGTRVMGASYDLTQSGDAQTKMRDLVMSDWYRERWDVALREDRQSLMHYWTVAGGWRMGVAVSAPRMGQHPHLKIVDDPHNPRKQLLSDTDIKDAQQWYDLFKIRGAMFPAPTVLIMQRLHERDLCGHLRATEADWTWLVLPMRWEPKRMVQVPTGWVDPREGQPGALLWPEAWPADRVTKTYPPGSWIEASQAQQRPAPAGGLMFKRTQFPVVHVLPSDVVAEVRSWDVAGTDVAEKTPQSARTAGVRMLATASGKYIVRDVRKGWWGAAEVDAEMLQTAQLDGREVPVWEEREGGSSGKAVIAARRRLLVGYGYNEYRLAGKGSKVQRAIPLQSQAQGGNCAIYVPLLPDGTPHPAAQQMAQEFLDEIELFPAGTLKDQVDAATQAFNVLTAGGAQQDLDLSTGGPGDAAQETEEQRAARELERTAEAERVVLDEIRRNGVYWPGGGGGYFNDR